MTAYYNECDPKAAAWLRELIRCGHIAHGWVDERSILDVRPSDLDGFAQHHFFAGIGVWSYALRSAGWPDDEPVWTGSCPCQPFSAAGQRKGVDDERHLWPAFHWLISQRRPGVVFGEQVESKDGRTWLDSVQADMEGLDYAFGPAALPAAGFGAPHPRHRLFWVADTQHPERGAEQQEHGDTYGRDGLGGSSVTGELADDDDDEGLQGRRGMPQRPAERLAGAGCMVVGMEHSNVSREHSGASGGEQSLCIERDRRARALEHAAGQQEGIPRFARESGATRGYWGDAHWISCRGGKWRPIEPGTFPLAHGSPARMGRLRGYGNAIVAPVAQEFIEAYIHRELT